MINKTAQQKRSTEWQKATKDELFLQDISDIEREFEGLSEETTSRMDR